MDRKAKEMAECDDENKDAEQDEAVVQDEDAVQDKDAEQNEGTKQSSPGSSKVHNNPWPSNSYLLLFKFL